MARQSRSSLMIFFMLLFVTQLLLSGCLQKQVRSENIKNVNLELEWSKVKKEVGRDMINPALVEIRLLTDKDGSVTLYSWQWIEQARVDGVYKVYFAEKNQNGYKVIGGTNLYSNVPKRISMEIALNIVNKYGLSKIFNDIGEASFVLRPAIEPKFSVINSKHLLVKGNVEVSKNEIELGKTYVEGLYGSPNGNRQYMFGVDSNID